ncbi:MAG TPA: crossover junction endodeoxyribonuclease RuvC [Candidatus Paceibacterota bacterium]|nr:crossover junction endodeoxyribonuclease RuvC [Candidatus Paceibacterota bacterium]
MRILAFDPGFERLGAAVVEKVGGKEVLVHSECVRTLAEDSFPTRLQQIGDAAEALIKQFMPDAVALEEIFFGKNEKTGVQIAEVRGVLTYIAMSHGLTVYDYTPLEVKIAITGYGKSDKKAVAAMVPRLVRLPTRSRLDDEMDAIAVGLTCLASIRTKV